MTLDRIPRLIATVAIPFSILFALLAWVVSSPPGSSPDDDYHMASIWCAHGSIAGQCETAGSDRYRMLPADLVEAAQCFRFKSDQTATCPLPEGKMEKTDRGNWYGNAYPPLYYWVMGVFVGKSLSASVILMRAVNAVLYVGLLTGLFFALPRRRRPVLIWSAAITAIPLGVFLMSSLNPSAWAVLSATGLWLATWGFLERHGPARWVLAGLATIFLVMGAGARSDAAVYGVLGLLVAVVLGFRRDRRFFLSLLLPLALAIVAALFFFSGGQAGVVGSDTANSHPPYALSTLAFVDALKLPELWAGVLGTWGLGWFDTPMPGIVWVTTMTVFAGVAFWGLRLLPLRKSIALAGVAFSLILVPMYILLHDGVIVGGYVQPRYIYPLIIIFAGVALVGFQSANLGLGRFQITFVAAGLTVANSVALHTNLRRYVTGLDVPNFNLNGGIEWWWAGPVSPMAVWVAGSVVFAIAAALLVWRIWGVQKLEGLAQSSLSPGA